MPNIIVTCVKITRLGYIKKKKKIIKRFGFVYYFY